jgi:hypothetical protein
LKLLQIFIYKKSLVGKIDRKPACDMVASANCYRTCDVQSSSLSIRNMPTPGDGDRTRPPRFTTRRRSDPTKEKLWRGTVRRHQESDLSVRDFCQREGLKDGNFLRRRRELTTREYPTLTMTEIWEGANPPASRWTDRPGGGTIQSGDAGQGRAWRRELPEGEPGAAGRPVLATAAIREAALRQRSLAA